MFDILFTHFPELTNITLFSLFLFAGILLVPGSSILFNKDGGGGGGAAPGSDGGGGGSASGAGGEGASGGESGGSPGGDAGEPAGNSGGSGVQPLSRSEMDELVAMTDKMSGEGDGGDPTPGGGDGPGKEEPGRQEGPPAGQEDPPGDDNIEYRDGFEEDTVDVDGRPYFFHPSEHGKDTGQGTTYRSRDDAELGWTNKVKRIQELTSKLKELGKDVGPVELPEWLGNPDSEDTYNNLLDIDYPLQLKNADLREHIQQGDKLITYLNSRVDRLSKQNTHTEQRQKLEQQRDEILDRSAQVVQELNLDIANIPRFKDQKQQDEAIRKAVSDAVERKVAGDLKTLTEEYKKLKSDRDAAADDDNYGDKLEEKFRELEAKRRELSGKYREQYLKPFEEISELREQWTAVEAQSDPEITEKERARMRTAAFQDLQSELKDKHPIFMSSDRRGVESFMNWMEQRYDEFNGALTTHDQYRALKAWDNHIQQRRQEIRRKQAEEQNSKQQEAGDKIPPYGDQKAITNNTGNKTARDKAKEELSSLAAETDARVR